MSAKRSGAAVIAMAALFAAGPLGAETFGPYLGAATETTITVAWRTDVPSTSRVEWGLGDSAAVLDQAVDDGALVVQHELVLEGLTPGQRHSYRAVSEADGTTVFESGPHTFFSAAPRGTPFRFVFLAEVHESIETALFDEEIAAFDPWLQVQTGDNIDEADRLAQFQNFFTQGAFYASVPLYTAFGNHNYQTDGGFLPENTDAELSLALLPPHQRYYTVRYGDVLFLILDSEAYLSSDVRRDEPMWLEQQLQEARDGIDDPAFLVAVFHIPPFSSCGELGCITRKLFENPWVDDELVSRIEQYGVDLVLVGHDKINEYSVVNGVSYVQVTSGADPRDLGAPNPGSRFADDSGLAVMLAEVRDCTLTFDLVDTEGNVIYGDSIDGDCNDADGDGFGLPADCDDTVASVYPGALEICGDGVDQDCDGDDTPCDGGDEADAVSDAPLEPRRDAGTSDSGDAGLRADTHDSGERATGVDGPVTADTASGGSGPVDAPAEGCGCATSTATPEPAIAALFLLLVWLRGRRERIGRRGPPPITTRARSTSRSDRPG